MPGVASVFVKDESVHTTGTFKDRLTDAVLEDCPDGAVVATISYGNTALSLAAGIGMAKRRGRAIDGFVMLPRDLSTWQLGPSSSQNTLAGAIVVSHITQTLRIAPLPDRIVTPEELLTLAAETLRHPSSTIIDITEGYRVPAYAAIAREILDQLGRPPDVCIVPYGAGILCNEIRDVLVPLGTIVIPVAATRRDSAARMLYGPQWLDIEELAHHGHTWSQHRSPDATGAVREPYIVYALSESDILRCIVMANALGISAEPSGAASLAPLDKLESYGVRPGHATVVCINSGNSIDRLR